MKRKHVFLTIVATVIIGVIVMIALLTMKGDWVATSAKISIVGDVLLDRGVKEIINLHKDNPGYPYEGVSEMLNDSDITIGNLEGPITNNGAPVLKKGNLIFRGNPLNVAYLFNAGFRAFNLANNHSMDYGSKGMSESITLLNKGGIRTFGGGFNKKDAEKPEYMKFGVNKIGLLGFSAFPPEGYFCFDDRPDVTHLEEDRLQGIIKAAKEHCDVLIVMFHWGEEFSYYADEHQKTVAHLACDSGADIVIGHHPHVLQGVEKYKEKYIFYSLGNFIFDRQIPNGTDESGILQLLINNKKIQKVSLLPVKIDECKPRICSSEETKHIYDRFSLYSKDLGVTIDYQESGFIIK